MLAGDVELIIAERDYWKAFEHDGWRLVSFSGRTTGQFQKKHTAGRVTIESAQIRFLRDVNRSVLDQA